MSERSQQYTRTDQYRPPVMPDSVPEHEERVDSLKNPKGPNWLRRSIALGAAGMTLAAGILIGVKVAGGHDSDPTSPAKGVETSAPANPSQSPEATATASPQETHDTTTSDLTPETFPFVGEDGKTYEGDAAFGRSIELAGPYTEETVRTELPNDAIAALNEWMASGATKTGEEAYGSYVSPNGKTGLEGIAADFYDPTFRNSLTTNTTNTEDLSGMMESAHQNYLDMYGTTKSGTNPYHGEYKLHDVSNIITGDGLIAFDAHISYDDNQPAVTTGKGTIGRHIELKLAPGTDGRLVWKFDRFLESAALGN